MTVFHLCHWVQGLKYLLGLIFYYSYNLIISVFCLNFNIYTVRYIKTVHITLFIPINYVFTIPPDYSDLQSL